ncbi:MAG: hypothetical protein LUP97_01635 [Methanoregula sp.]|nr:hypothetical protein [Methanoregula sp.]
MGLGAVAFIVVRRH